MARKEKKQENFMDYVPKHNSLFEFQENKKHHVEIRIHNKGVINKIFQKLFRKPKYSYIELDDFGTFVWNNIDGQQTVFDIGNRIKEKFGKDAEPVYDRLCKFMNILHNNKFIVYTNKIKPKTDK